MAEPTPGPAPESSRPSSNDDRADNKSLHATLYDTSLAVRNEAIVQSANLYLMARRVLMTSLGAVAMTLEETNDFIERLVDRGEVAETELSRIVNEYVERSNEREYQAMEMRRATVDKAAVALADSVEVILGRLNVPTRTDIEELSRKIGQLNDKVMALKSQRARIAAAPPPLPPPLADKAPDAAQTADPAPVQASGSAA